MGGEIFVNFGMPLTLHSLAWLLEEKPAKPISRTLSFDKIYRAYALYTVHTLDLLSKVILEIFVALLNWIPQALHYDDICRSSPKK